MYRWCSRCNEKRREGEVICRVCQHSTDLELDINDTLRIDSRREFVVTKQLSHYTDAGMSAVYLAARKDKPAMFGAIKVAKPDRVQALQREAEHLQKLKHDHIIRLVHPEQALWQDHKDNSTLHFFALEYMDGGTLKDKLSQKKKLSLDEAAPIILAVGRALAYAHRNGFVHLDVKPANILFGSDGRIVLSDFGISRDFLQAHDLKKRVGTLFYNSPEQLTENPVHSHKADIYALGIIMYEMLVGPERFRQQRSSSSSKSDSQPSGGAKPTSKPTSNLANLPPPRKMEPRMPRAVEGVILKAIAENPADRYDNVDTMLDELTLALSQPPEQKKWLLLLAGAGILAALGLIGLGLFIFMSRQTSTMAAMTTATPTATTEVAAATATPQPGVIIVASATPKPTVESAKPSNDIIGQPPTATRRATTTPTPARARPTTADTVVPDGFIELVAPTDNIQIGDTVEFQWKWHENKGCQSPPAGYAFEIRIWPDNNTSQPMGAMDAGAEKSRIHCDPGSGIHSFTIGRIRDVPGARGLANGRLRWDVALVQVDPYQPIITPTTFRTFFY
ncbi:MAG: hypothetical protein Fur0044_21960 [Anaerolineae bacterium]